MLAYAKWRHGWIVADAGYVRVRAVPLVTTGIAIPGTTDLCYVVEIGHYPFDSTFRVQWDSYEAKEIRIKLPAHESPGVDVDFDSLYRVRASLGGSVQSVQWTTR